MKLKSAILFGVLAMASAASAQTIVTITGATAFRAAANNSILTLLGGPGVTEYAFTGTSGLGGSNRVIFKGNIDGQPYIVLTSWSGSTQGILDLADQSLVEVLKPDTATSTGGINVPGGLEPDPSVFEQRTPRWAFSDVDQQLSQRPNAPLAGGPVGVVPFMFIAGQGAPAGMTNMTDQVHELLWSTGQANASFFTGSPSTTTVLATGRNNGSGTRATILAETQYGAFRNVVQFNAAFVGSRTEPFPTANLGEIAEFGNGGNRSNSGVRDLLTRPRNGLTFGGEPVDAVFCSYLTISDALNATGYNPVDGSVSGGEGGIPMTYNGVRYSVENVKNGSYSLWGYQQFYMAPDFTAGELAFDTALRTIIPANMGTAGIPIPDMNVDRVGGDGGIIQPQD